MARSTDRARAPHAAVAVGSAVPVTVLLAPWTRATSSSGGTWSWNVLGWPLVPGSVGLVLWAGTTAVVALAAWLIGGRRRRAIR